MADTTLQILIKATDDASQAFQNIAAGLDQDGQKAMSAQQQMQQLGDAMQSAGTKLIGAGAAADAFYGAVVYAAAQTEASQEQLAVSVGNVVKQANDAAGANSAYATQVEFLQNKIDSTKASIANYTVEMDKTSDSTAKGQAAQEKYSAELATAQQTVDKYQNMLDTLTNKQTLVGQSAADITKKFEDLAESSTNLGFQIDDSQKSLGQLFQVTGSVTEATSAYQSAMDLARMKNEDLGTATNQVIQGLNGQGKALQLIGINVKDGLSGMDALNAIQEQVNGSAQKYSETLSGQMAVSLAKINQLFDDMGKTQLPALEKIFTAIDKVITAVDQWATEHPKLTTAILVGVAAFGVLATVIGTVLVVAGAFIAAIATVGGVFALWTVAIVAAIAVLVALAVAVVEYHTQIWEFLQKIWGDIEAFFESTWNSIRNAWDSFWQGVEKDGQTIWQSITRSLQDAWNVVAEFFATAWATLALGWSKFWNDASTLVTQVWSGIKSGITDAFGGIQDFISTTSSAIWETWQTLWGNIKDFFLSIWDDMVAGFKASINTIISMINSFINGFNAIKISVPEVNIPGVGKVGGFSIGMPTIPDIPMLALGGIVTSPTLALIGEAGPEAVIPLSQYGGQNGQGNITINLSGDFYTDQQTATKWANQIAKIINKQLKLRTF